MSKYILKKDLPFANKGAEILIGLNDWCYVIHKKATEKEIEEGNTWIGQMWDLIDSGWIEEVKPREFTVIIYPKGNARIKEEDGFNIESGISTEIIKVREVE